MDASSEMLAQASEFLKREGFEPNGHLFHDELPRLSTLADTEFDGVLCTAVLMHLPEESIFDAVYTLRHLLRPNGTLVVSIPNRRPGDVDPNTRRDRDGRLFSNLPPAKLRLLFERVGFVVRSTEEVPDSLGRDGFTWDFTVLTRLDDSAERPLNLVESILNRDKKDATYKLALFRALAEIAQTESHLAAYTVAGKVKIPLRSIAEKWILYYWPIFQDDLFIPQRTNERLGQGPGVAIRKPLNQLIGHFKHAGGLSGFYSDWKSGRLVGEAQRSFKSALRQVQTTIHAMPAKHAGGGDYAVFQYDSTDQSLLMDIGLWRELCLMGNWIRDATLLRWAELTEAFAKGTVKASLVIDRLLVAPDLGRNVREAQKYFAALSSRPCVWSQRELRHKPFDVDHAMPFSYWRNNDLWNLFPASPEVNAAKSDKLPTYRQLHQSRDIIIGYWRGLEEAMGARFVLEAQTLLGRDPFRKGNWESLLFSRFVEAFETTANQRGAGRWQWPAVRTENVGPKAIPRSPLSYTTHEEKRYVAPSLVPFSQVRNRAFKTYLPLVGSLAAGLPFAGFETDSLSDHCALDWVEVPAHLVKPRRFVVRVAGDSMAPTLNMGDFAVFEYHRSSRSDNQIVIANIPEFGDAVDSTQAIKRLKQDSEHWIFSSDNSDYPSIRVRKDETSHPILGTFVEKLYAHDEWA